MSDKGLWIVIPAFNEASVIRDVVRAVRAAFPNVVVVDDCSRDATGELALAEGAVVVRHPVNLGQGAALQTGIDYALSRGAQRVATFDADGQHEVRDLSSMLTVMHERRVDCVLGSRFLGAAKDIPRARRLLLKAATIFTWLTTGVRLTDAHNGFRLFNAAAARKLDIQQNRMAHASEIVEQIRKLGITFVEAPVHIRYTPYSVAKGQRSWDALRIVADLIVARINK